jgi:hypothetical protein
MKSILSIYRRIAIPNKRLLVFLFFENSISPVGIVIRLSYITLN